MVTLYLALMLQFADVPVIENGLSPKGEPMTLELVEDLRIGPESGEDHHIWSGATVALDANAKGHMFVTDPEGDRVIWFDEKGKLVKVFGGPGEGPGQFKFLTSFQILEDQTGIALDSIQRRSRFHTFDSGMDFQKLIRNDGIDRLLKSAHFSPSGKYFSSLWVTVNNEENHIVHHVGILDRDRNIMLGLSQDRNDKFDGSKSRDPNYWGDLIADHLSAGVSGMAKVAFCQDGSFYTANANTYEITHWSPDFKKQRIIRKKYTPLTQSQDEILASTEPLREQIISAIPANFRNMVSPKIVAAAIEKAEIPARRHPIYAMYAMEDNGFLILHDYTFSNRNAVVDIFDKDGQFIGAATMPPMQANIYYTEAARVRFKNGYLYMMEINENDENSLVRYKVKVKKAS